MPELLTEEQLQRRLEQQKLKETCQDSTLAAQFHTEFQANDKKSQPPDLSNAKLDSLLNILKKKTHPPGFDQNFRVWRMEIERLIDLGYTCKGPVEDKIDYRNWKSPE